MKTLAGLIVSMAALCGCGSLPSEPVADRYQFDTVRMNAVEQAAVRAGVRVYWINAPRKASNPVDG